MLPAIPTEHTLSPRSGETDWGSQEVEDHLPPLFQALPKVGFKLYIFLGRAQGEQVVLRRESHPKIIFVFVHIGILQLTR